MTDTPLTAKELRGWRRLDRDHDGKYPVSVGKALTTIAALTERAERAEADVAAMKDAPSVGWWTAALEKERARAAELEATAKWNVYVAFADCHPDFKSFREGWEMVPEDKAWRASDDYE